MACTDIRIRFDMKTKKIIITILSIIAAVAIIGTVSLAIAAGNEEMTLGQYWSKLVGRSDKEIGAEALIKINNNETMSVSSFRSFLATQELQGYTYTAEDIDKEIQLYIRRELLQQEAESRGLKVSDDELDAVIKAQKESMKILIETDPEMAKAYTEFFDRLDVTVDEYYDREDVRAAYARLSLIGKLEADEAQKRGITDDKERAEILDNIAESLKKKAKIVINQEKLGMLKREAAERAGE